jgi:AraC family transcriptional regulator
MKLSVKNMVCPRCVESVSNIVNRLDLPALNVQLGLVELDRPLTGEEHQMLSEQLHQSGFELIFDRETELVNIVKSQLIGYVEYLEAEDQPEKLSVYVSRNSNYNYSYLSKVFSEQTGETIETYLIQLKIERVKELLSFRRWTLSEIAWKLKYSSVQYLSNQFKKVTGMTVTDYLARNEHSRTSLDQL